MPQIVLRAEPGDYAPTVLLCGDVARASAIAERFDAQARLVTDHRGMLGWTGTLHGAPMSVQTTGMGAPSMAIIVEELLNLGARRLLRVGTCGGLARGMQPGDIVIATAAAPADGATRAHLDGAAYAPAADHHLTQQLVQAAREAGLDPWVGPVATVDLLYDPHPDYAETWRSRGVLAVEMEASILFYLASRATAAGNEVRAACILTVSDTLSAEASTADTYLPLERLTAAAERTIEVALAVAASTPPAEAE